MELQIRSVGSWRKFVQPCGALVGMDHILGLASSVAVSSVRWERALGVMEFVD